MPQKKTKRVTVRFQQLDADLLEQISEDRGEDTSDFVRRAVKIEFARLGLLSTGKSKALGIKENRSVST